MTNEQIIEIIRENYDKLSTDEIGRLIGKSGNAVRSIAFDNGITKRNKSYTPKEDEYFKVIPEFPNYKISNYGTVLNISRNFVLKWISHPEGYFHVKLRKDGIRKSFKVHRLVAMNFCEGYFEGAVVNHIDGNKENNHCSNLEWCTHSHNLKHAYDTGLRKSAGGTSKYSDEIVIKICEELQLGIFSQSDISKMYDVPTWLVKDIKQRVTYKHISKDFIF